MIEPGAARPVVLHRHASAEDVGRANFYALAARLFAAPADQPLLSGIAGAPPLETEDAGLPLARSWSALIAACSAMDEAASLLPLPVGTGNTEMMTFSWVWPVVP